MTASDLPSSSAPAGLADRATRSDEVLLVGGGFLASRELAHLLRSNGFTVEPCPRVTDAVGEAVRSCPTVVLFDARDGLGDVLSAIGEFRRSPEVGAVPCMVLASASTATIRDEAFSRGVHDFIVEPVSRMELLARIRTQSAAYLNVVRRNRAISDYETLQSELRHMRGELEHAKLMLAARDGASEGAQWQTRAHSLMELGLKLNQIHDLHELLERILKEAMHLVRADAGTIFLREDTHLRFAHFRNQTLAERTALGQAPQISSFRLPITDRSIAGWVCLTGQELHIADCYAIPPDAPYKFESSFDQLLGYRTRAMIAMPMRNQLGRILGVMELINPLHEDGTPRASFSEGDIKLIGHFANVATVALERAHRMNNNLWRMISMAELRDPAETRRHVERVAAYSIVIFDEWARRHGLIGTAFERLRLRLDTAAKVHDIGKFEISDTILTKPGPLTPEEFEIVKQHVHAGANLYVNDPDDFDEAARLVALMHHERWDGSGYPGIVEGGGRRGRRGTEIPLNARIVGLADVLDALLSPRCYKEAWSEDRAFEAIKEQSGKHFDPELVEILFACVDQMREVRQRLPELPGERAPEQT